MFPCRLYCPGAHPGESLLSTSAFDNEKKCLSFLSYTCHLSYCAVSAPNPCPPPWSHIIGKHRKHPGGRGKAGGLTHHRINFDLYHPGFFGKRGMRHFHVQRNQSYRPVVNLDKLWSLTSEEVLVRAWRGSFMRAHTQKQLAILESYSPSSSCLVS